MQNFERLTADDFADVITASAIVSVIEHDCYHGHCSNCKTQGVKSGFALMGII